MKYLAARKLYLENGISVKTGMPVPGFEKWPQSLQVLHLQKGMVRAVDERTGKSAQPHATKAGATAMKTQAAPARVAVGGRKASQVKRRG